MVFSKSLEVIVLEKWGSINDDDLLLRVMFVLAGSTFKGFALASQLCESKSGELQAAIDAARDKTPTSEELRFALSNVL